MARKFFALLAGVMAAITVVGLIEYLAHMMYAPAVPPDRHDPEAMRAFVAAMPTGAFLMILLAYAAGTFLGGMITARLARSRAWRFAGSIGALILLFALLNIMMVPHPLWFIVAVIVAVPLAASLARALGMPKPAD